MQSDWIQFSCFLQGGWGLQISKVAWDTIISKSTMGAGQCLIHGNPQSIAVHVNRMKREEVIYNFAFVDIILLMNEPLQGKSKKKFCTSQWGGPMKREGHNNKCGRKGAHLRLHQWYIRLATRVVGDFHRL